MPDETNPTAAVARTEGGKAPMLMGSRGVELKTLAEALRFAEAIVQSRLAPDGDSPATVMIKLQAGAELGFPPMRALAALVVVNGRLSMMGEAMLALIRQSKVGRITVGIEGTDASRYAFADIERFGTGEKDRVTFTVTDAKQAGLWNKKSSGGKDTPWVGYPDDMLIWKAVSRAAKRYFSDVVMGLDVAEAVAEYPPLTARTEGARPPITVVPAPEQPPDPLLARVITEPAKHSDVEIPIGDERAQPPDDDDEGSFRLTSPARRASGRRSFSE